MDRIVLIQHCQSAHHLDRGAGPDSELTDLGRKQASCVAERIAAELGGAECRLVSSDLRRAWQTAEIIGARVNARPVAESDLREWNGRHADAMSPQEQQRAAADRRWFLFDWPCEAGVESWRAFHARVGGCMERLCTAAPEGPPLVVVAHGGTISNIVAWWLGMPVDVLPARTPFAPSPGSISVLTKNRYGEPLIERLNDRSHLITAELIKPVSLFGEKG